MFISSISLLSQLLLRIIVHPKYIEKPVLKMATCSQGNPHEAGAARYGNFRDYYRFNPPDERMKYVSQLPAEYFSKLAGNKRVECLDIGCNTGVSK